MAQNKTLLLSQLEFAIMPTTDALVEGEIDSAEDPSPGQQLTHLYLSFSTSDLCLLICPAQLLGSVDCKR